MSIFKNKIYAPIKKILDSRVEATGITFQFVRRKYFGMYVKH